MTDATARLPAALRDAMVAQAQTEAPFEACGVVAADAEGRAVGYHPLPNIAGRLDWFEPDPRALLRVTMEIEDGGGSLWGIYHSHPRSPARPSESDIALASYPDSLYLICSLEPVDQPGLRAWRIRDGAAREVPLTIVPA